MGDRLMIQRAPWPQALEDLVAKVRYRPGWTVRLVTDLERDFESDDTERQRCIGRGTTLIITTRGYDSYHPDRGEDYRVNHYFIVPAATYDPRSWRRWLFEQFLLVERHEAMEFFQVVEGSKEDGPYVTASGKTIEESVVRPYAPHHGPGNDPYIVFEHGTDLDIRTRFTGEVA